MFPKCLSQNVNKMLVDGSLVLHWRRGVCTSRNLNSVSPFQISFLVLDCFNCYPKASGGMTRQHMWPQIPCNQNWKLHFLQMRLVLSSGPTILSFAKKWMVHHCSFALHFETVHFARRIHFSIGRLRGRGNKPREICSSQNTWVWISLQIWCHNPRLY